MKNTILTVGGLIGATILGFATYIVVANEYNYRVSEKEEKRKEESEKFRIITDDLHRIEFELVKLNSKISSLKS